MNPCSVSADRFVQMWAEAQRTDGIGPFQRCHVKIAKRLQRVVRVLRTGFHGVQFHIPHVRKVTPGTEAATQERKPGIGAGVPLIHSNRLRILERGSRETPMPASSQRTESRAGLSYTNAPGAS